MAHDLAVKERQRLRRERRAQQREARRTIMAFQIFHSERPQDADEYMARADRAIAVEHARAKGEL